MKENQHIQLLEILEKIGLSASYDVGEFLRTHFAGPGFDKKGDVTDAKRVVMDFLKDLKELGHISFNDSELATAFLSDGIMFAWDNVIFRIRLRSKGLEYLHQYRVVKANLENLKRQNWVVPTTLLISILGLIIAMGNALFTWFKD